MRFDGADLALFSQVGFFDRLAGGHTDIVGHAREESYLDCVIKDTGCRAVNREFLDHGIDELVSDLRELLRSKIP